jgi:hypothetical protein
MTRAPGAALAALALLAACASCAGASRTDRDYSLKAANTAEAVASAVNTARFGVDAAARGRAPANFLSVLLGEAEEDALGAQESFDSRQPPSARSDRLRAELDDLLAEATEVLSRLRIAVRRGDLDLLPDLAAPLVGLAGRLDDFEQTHGRGP